MNSCNRRNRDRQRTLARHPAASTMDRRRKKNVAKRRERGSVSIYFIAATSGFVLLSALLIDFSRIAAFRKQAELSVQAGVRSVLSSFDPIVYERYGLLIRGGENGEQLLRAALDGEGTSERQSRQAFSYLTFEWTESEVIESRPLADHEVFRRQVLEEMKIKAPIDLTLELANRLGGVDTAIREAKETVDLLESMRKAYERREAALDRALNGQHEAGKRTINALSGLVPYPSEPPIGSLPAGPFSHLADAARRYGDYVAKRQADDASERAFWEAVAAGAELLPINIRPNAAVVAAYESSAAALSSRLAGAEAVLRQAVDAKIAAAAQALREAEAANDEMRSIAQAASASAGGSDGSSSSDSETVLNIGEGNASDILAEIRKTAESIVLERAFFDSYNAELQLQRDRTADVAEAVGASSSLLAVVAGTSHMSDALFDAANQLIAALSEYDDFYGNNGSVIDNRRALLEQHRSQDGQRKALEDEADTEWSGWKNMAKGLNNLQGTPEEQEAFRRVGERAGMIRTWNEERSEAPEVFAQEEPAAGRDAAMAGSSGVLDALGEALAGGRDSLFVSEYIHARYSRYSPDKIKQLLAGQSVPLDIKQQEAEYVLYGFTSPTANLAAAMGEIFAFRLAIRTFEGLIECRHAGHPLLVLAAALVYGVRHAVQDMQSLLDRDKVPLSKYAKIDTTYADYLRLFHLLHGNTGGTLTRSIAVFEHETGLDATQTYTYASAEATASLKLWFFPGLLKQLNRTGNLGGIVKGNRYEATYTAEMGYQ